MKDQIKKPKKYFHYQKEILNTISEPASFINRNYKYVFVNTAFNNFHEVQTNRIIGKTMNELWHPEIFESSIKPQMDKCLKGQPVFFQYDGKMPNGIQKIIEINYYPHRKITGRIDGVIETIKDITEKKKAEKTLKRSEARLKELNAAKDKLFSIIGHDLKGPLNNILGFSELIEVGHLNYSAEEILNYNRLILQSAQSLSGLLENLLTWSRTQNKKITASPQEIVIQLVIQQCLDLLKHNADKKQILFVNEIPPETIVFADLEMITIILRNLISNAIKFSKTGETITAVLKSEKEKVIIGIRDTGVGISEDKIKNLFHTEANISTLGTDGEKGTGLGLIICKDFIEKNNGEIWVESEYGKGSCFYFSLPVKTVIHKKVTQLCS